MCTSWYFLGQLVFSVTEWKTASKSGPLVLWVGRLFGWLASRLVSISRRRFIVPPRPIVQGGIRSNIIENDALSVYPNLTLHFCLASTFTGFQFSYTFFDGDIRSFHFYYIFRFLKPANEWDYGINMFINLNCTPRENCQCIKYLSNNLKEIIP